MKEPGFDRSARTAGLALTSSCSACRFASVESRHLYRGDDPRQPFDSYGIDSLTAVMILGRLEKRVGRRLSPTLIWNYPNIEALSARLNAPLRSASPPEPQAARSPD
jgi:acyl carrier protein